MEEAMAGMGIFGFVIILIFSVLLLLMPFFIYGTNARTRQTALALKETNKLLRGILNELRNS